MKTYLTPDKLGEPIRVKLIGKHPYRGKVGKVICVESTRLGLFPVVELDSGVRTLITHKGQFVRL